MHGITCIVGQMMFHLRAYASGLNGRPTWSVLWVSATDHLIRKKKQVRSSDNRKNSPVCMSLISGPWETPITPTSAERQQNRTSAIQDTFGVHGDKFLAQMT